MTENRSIKKILIANRGEIVLRVMRTVREMGLESVVVYEKPDVDEHFIRMADEAILIGDGPRKDYLDIERMIWAARKSGADAIHPGIGFLAENMDFSEACEKAGILFIGPTADVIRNTGNKIAARELMEKAGIPVIPGTKALPHGSAAVKEAQAFGREHGYPIMLKSTLGGGGRGIRKVRSEAELVGRLLRVRSEARKAFRDESIYVENASRRPGTWRSRCLSTGTGISYNWPRGTARSSGVIRSSSESPRRTSPPTCWRAFVMPPLQPYALSVP